jgi:hypothetical protein
MNNRDVVSLQWLTENMEVRPGSDEYYKVFTYGMLSVRWHAETPHIKEWVSMSVGECFVKSLPTQHQVKKFMEAADSLGK